MKFENKKAWGLLDNFLLNCPEINQDEREEIINLIYKDKLEQKAEALIKAIEENRQGAIVSSNLNLIDSIIEFKYIVNEFEELKKEVKK